MPDYYVQHEAESEKTSCLGSLVKVKQQKKGMVLPV